MTPLATSEPQSVLELTLAAADLAGTRATTRDSTRPVVTTPLPKPIRTAMPTFSANQGQSVTTSGSTHPLTKLGSHQSTSTRRSFSFSTLRTSAATYCTSSVLRRKRETSRHSILGEVVRRMMMVYRVSTLTKNCSRRLTSPQSHSEHSRRFRCQQRQLPYSSRWKAWSYAHVPFHFLLPRARQLLRSRHCHSRVHSRSIESLDRRSSELSLPLHSRIWRHG